MASTCGMYICKKCGWINLIFGILFLIAALWNGLPAWFNPWTLIGLYLLLWGIGSAFMGKEH